MKFKQIGARAFVAVSAVLLPVLAFAQATDPFTDSVATATTKIGVYGAALVVLAAVGVVFKIGIKYVKRISGAA